MLAIDLSGRSALVTGGSRGIGSGIVRALAQSGARVAFTYSGSERGTEAATHLVKDLTDDEVNRIREVIDKGYRVEGDLRKEINFNIKRYIDIGCYRGLRHRRGLPVNGQRTRTNARTKRGARKTVAGRGRRRGMTKK